MRPELQRNSSTAYKSVLIRLTLFVILSLMFLQFLILFPKPVNNFSSVSKFKKISESVNDSENSKTALAQARQSQNASEQTIKGLHLTESLDKSRGWELIALEASGSDAGQWTLKKVSVQFYTDEAKTFHVKGEVGEIDSQSKNFVIRGQVVTESANGYIFETGELKYDAATRSLVSQDSVAMRSPENQPNMQTRLTGFGLRIEVATNKIFILDDVRSENVLDGEPFLLTSDEAEFSNLNREAKFLKTVRMKFRDYSTASERAHFTFDKESKLVDRVLLSPNVSIRGVEQSGVCQQLEIYPKKDLMVMRGKPRLKFKDDEISGEEIVLTDRGQKVKIQKASLSGMGRE